jgi:hypothetical protein
MEFMLYEDLPIYWGSLGSEAVDQIKTPSEMRSVSI